MELTTLWFCVITFFWMGFLILEGFDFGVGALSRLLGRDEDERGALLSTIGPVWDGNEVWMVVAVGSMFAAFPGWYASMMSAFYLPLVIILLGLIIRGVCLEWRGKSDDPQWRDRCEIGLLVSSLAVPFGWGVVLTGMAGGLTLDSDGRHLGGLTDLLSGYTLFGGAAFVALCVMHGWVFLRMRTYGILRSRMEPGVRRVLAPLAGIVGIFLVWTYAHTGGESVTGALLLAAGVALVALVVLAAGNRAGGDGWAFVSTTVAVGLTVVALFVSIFPAAIPSAEGAEQDLMLADAAASAYGLRILTIASAVLLPAVLAYQAWAYWVFRQRVGHEPVSLQRRNPPQTNPPQTNPTQTNPTDTEPTAREPS